MAAETLSLNATTIGSGDDVCSFREARVPRIRKNSIMKNSERCANGMDGLKLCRLAIFGSLLIGGLCSAAETLTLQGTNPHLILDDNVGTAETWNIFGNDTGFDIQSTGANAPQFHIDPTAPLNSLVLKAGGAIGMGTFLPDPLVSLHIASPLFNPSLRLQSTSVSPCVWDLRCNTSGIFFTDGLSGLTPFVVSAGSPTNTFVLNDNGNVSIGTGTADVNSKLDIRSSLLNGLLMKRATADPHYLRIENSGSVFRCGVQGNGDTQFGALTAGKGLSLLAGGTGKLAINSSGQISFGSTPTAITTHALVHTSGARLTAGGIWTDASSRSFKQDIEPITSEEARDTVRALQPVGYRYKSELDERYIGFIAEDVPELVATKDRKALAPMDIVGVLTKVVQDQDRELVQQRQTMATQDAALTALTKRLADLEQRMSADRGAGR